MSYLLLRPTRRSVDLAPMQGTGSHRWRADLRFHEPITSSTQQKSPKAWRPPSEPRAEKAEPRIEDNSREDNSRPPPMPDARPFEPTMPMPQIDFETKKPAKAKVHKRRWDKKTWKPIDVNNNIDKVADTLGVVEETPRVDADPLAASRRRRVAGSEKELNDASVLAHTHLLVDIPSRRMACRGPEYLTLAILDLIRQAESQPPLLCRHQGEAGPAIPAGKHGKSPSGGRVTPISRTPPHHGAPKVGSDVASPPAAAAAAAAIAAAATCGETAVGSATLLAASSLEAPIEAPIASPTSSSPTPTSAPATPHASTTPSPVTGRSSPPTRGSGGHSRGSSKPGSPASHAKRRTPRASPPPSRSPSPGGYAENISPSSAIAASKGRSRGGRATPSPPSPPEPPQSAEAAAAAAAAVAAATAAAAAAAAAAAEEHARQLECAAIEAADAYDALQSADVAADAELTEGALTRLLTNLSLHVAQMDAANNGRAPPVRLVRPESASGGEGAASSIECADVVKVVLGTLRVHRGHEGVQAIGCTLISHLANGARAKQQLVDGGAFGAVAEALDAHASSVHVVWGAALAILKLTLPDHFARMQSTDALRVRGAMASGVSDALNSLLERHGVWSKPPLVHAERPSRKALLLRLCTAGYVWIDYINKQYLRAMSPIPAPVPDIAEIEREPFFATGDALGSKPSTYELKEAPDPGPGVLQPGATLWPEMSNILHAMGVHHWFGGGRDADGADENHGAARALEA